MSYPREALLCEWMHWGGSELVEIVDVLEKEQVLVRDPGGAEWPVFANELIGKTPAARVFLREFLAGGLR